MANLVMIAATGAIAVAAIAALVVSIWSGIQARNTAHANIVSVFLQEYAGEKMYNHLEDLKKFEKENKKLLSELDRLGASTNYQDEKYADVAKKYAEEHEPTLWSARRHVFSFYKRAWRLYRNRYLGKRALGIIADTDGCDLLFRVVQTISPATHLIKVCDGDRQKLQSELSEFDWFKEFKKFRDTVK